MNVSSQASCALAVNEEHAAFLASLGAFEIGISRLLAGAGEFVILRLGLLALLGVGPLLEHDDPDLHLAIAVADVGLERLVQLRGDIACHDEVPSC